VREVARDAESKAEGGGRRTERIRIGNQTSISSDPMTPFDYAIGHRFDAFEWFPDRRPDGRGWSEGDLSPRARASIRNAAREHDIALSVHGAWDASLLSAAGNDTLLSQAEFAAEIGASTFVVHHSSADGLDQCVDGIGSLVGWLARHGIRIVVENTPQTSAGDVNELFRRLFSRGLPAGSVGMCFDIGHANLCPSTRNDYVGYLDQLAPDTPILHVHLHENWGDEDSHLTLFTGPAARDAAGVEALVDRLGRRHFSGCMILEQWPHPPGLLDLARDRLVRIIGATAAKFRAS